MLMEADIINQFCDVTETLNKRFIEIPPGIKKDDLDYSARVNRRAQDESGERVEDSERSGQK